jgi:hypothetical protein
MVESNLSGSGKADILREIESHVYDRAEALAAARGAADIEDTDLDKAMEELGDPSDLAVSYSGEKMIINPKEYTAFWYFTGLLFAVHLSMLLIAVLTSTRFNFFPFNVLPAGTVSGTRAVLTVISLAVQAFLFDAGLVMVVFFLLRRTFRRVELPNLTFRVESSVRPSLFRAAFSLVVALALVVPGIRDTLFKVTVEDAEGVLVHHTLLLPPLMEAIPWIVAFLVLAMVKDILYAFLRERPLTVGLDLVTAAGGVVLALYLFSRDGLVGLPADFPLDANGLAVFNQFLAKALGLFFIVWAALFASRGVKRALRLRQLWGEKDPEGL